MNYLEFKKCYDQEIKCNFAIIAKPGFSNKEAQERADKQ